MKPVYELSSGRAVLSEKKETDLKDVYWKCIGDCKHGHIVLSYDIVKQPHCPVCEPDVDMNKHWVSVWQDPCPECGKQ